MKTLLALALVLVPGLALAQTSSAPAHTPSTPQKTTTIHIDDGETIEGVRKTAGGLIVLVDPEVKHTSLLKIRESFADRVLDSAGELR